MAEQPIAHAPFAHALADQPLGQYMLELLRCDSCNKPLGQAAVKRGDAEDRGGVIVCASCSSLEAKGYGLPISASEEGKAKFKAYYANLHASAIQRVKEEATAAVTTDVIEEDELDTDPIESAPAAPIAPGLKIVGPDGKALSARIRANADGEVVIEVDGAAAGPPSKPKRAGRDTTEPTNIVKDPSRPRLPKPHMSRTSLARRMEVESAATKQGRSFNMRAATLFLVVVLAALGFAIFVAIDTQRKLNERQLAVGEGEKKKTQSGDYQPADTRRNEGNPEPRKTDTNGNAKADNAKVESAQPERFPRELPEDVRAALQAHERDSARSITKKLLARDLEVRLAGLADAIAEIAIDCAPIIRPMLRAADPSERQLACEALGFLMVSDARGDLERIKNDEKEALYVRLAAGRALSRLDFRVHDQDLEGWTLEELTSLREVLQRRKDNPQALAIVERAIQAREGEE